MLKSIIKQNLSCNSHHLLLVLSWLLSCSSEAALRQSGDCFQPVSKANQWRPPLKSVQTLHPWAHRLKPPPISLARAARFRPAGIWATTKERAARGATVLPPSQNAGTIGSCSSQSAGLHSALSRIFMEDIKSFIFRWSFDFEYCFCCCEVKSNSNSDPM